MPVITRVHKLLLLIFGFVLSFAVNAENKPLYTIFTGTDRNAFYEMGLDIKRACPQYEIQVIKTSGTLDNINQMIDGSAFQTGYRFGFVQDDVIETVSASEPRVQNLVKTVFPMHNIEITIIVNQQSKISNIAGLANRRVAVGPSSSASWFSASIIRNALGFYWVPVEKSIQEGLLGVLTGQFDALILSASQPYELYSILGPSVKSRIKFLDLTEIPPIKLYTPVVIPPNTYEWQDYPVHALAVSSSFMVSSSVPQGAILNLSACIMSHHDDLIKNGHPKWRAIQLQKVKSRGN